jgi:hypothetical protein
VTTSEQHYLDDVAKALASGTVLRRQALKLIGAALAGAAAALIPGVASAAPHVPWTSPSKEAMVREAVSPREGPGAIGALGRLNARATATAGEAARATVLTDNRGSGSVVSVEV